MEDMASALPKAETEAPASDGGELRRRAALTKLGLAAGTVYFAPTVLQIDRGLAQSISSSCQNGNSPSNPNANPNSGCNAGGGDNMDGSEDPGNSGNDND